MELTKILQLSFDDFFGDTLADSVDSRWSHHLFGLGTAPALRCPGVLVLPVRPLELEPAGLTTNRQRAAPQAAALR